MSLLLALNIFDALHDLAKACNFTKINTPIWVFFTFFKLYKWYQIVQRITYSRPYSNVSIVTFEQ